MSTEYSPYTDELIAKNDQYVANFAHAGMAVQPSRTIAVVTCMDARVNILDALGIADGEAHVIRNGGGVVTDDVIRSLCLSQRKLGTREILLAHHTDCGLATVTDDAFKAELEAELGVKPSWALENFTDPVADVVQSINRLKQSPFLPHKDNIRGFVYDVATGKINEVAAS